MGELFNFSNIGSTERESMALTKIDYSKYFSKLAGKSRDDSKPSHCLYCLKKHNKFCNSHSVPASFLNNIAVDGKIYTVNKIIDLPLYDTEKGIKNSGTFQVICRECDNKVFKEYENPSNYNQNPTDKMLAQIALKNHLRNIGKRRFEIALYKNMQKEIQANSSRNPFAEAYFSEMLKVGLLDLNEFLKDFNHAKKTIEKNWQNEHYLFFFERVNYNVSIAFQGEICLYFDFFGNVLNDIYNKSKTYKLQTFHIAIFPMGTYSIIMMFLKKNNKRLRQFYRQFNELEFKEKLSTINFIVFSHSEDVFINKNFHDNYMNDESLKKVAGLTSIQFSEADNINNDVLKEEYCLSKRNNIPNFLLAGR